MKSTHGITGLLVIKKKKKEKKVDRKTKRLCNRLKPSGPCTRLIILLMVFTT